MHIEDRLLELERMVHHLLSDNIAHEVLESIEYGEWGLALECLCDCLWGNDIPAPEEAKSLIRELEDQMGLDRGSIAGVLEAGVPARPSIRTLDEAIAALADWKQPMGAACPFRLACRLEPGAGPAEIEAAGLGTPPPSEVASLWSVTREAWFFEDTDHGQWGLHLLSSSAGAARTAAEAGGWPEDFRPGDIVLGEFLGDQELLVHAPSEEGRRRYLVALPLDPRCDWYGVGASVVEVLEPRSGQRHDKE